MVGKQSHIRNPLTVIAIFAGIAELSGTAVLPALEPAVQYIYVWFLMGFPTALVVLFFLVLYLKHHVLYAPSDFRDDKGWLSLAERRVYLERKVDRALVEASEELSIEASEVNEAAAYDTSGISNAAEDTEAQASGSADNPATTEERVVEHLTPISARARWDTLFRHPIPITRNAATGQLYAVRDLASSALEAETFFKEVVGKQRGINWSGDSQSLARFDAISDGRPIVVLETHYTRHGRSLGPRSQRIKKIFEDVLTFYQFLSEADREGFLFLYCMAYEDVSFRRMAAFRSQIEKLGSEFPFKTEVMVEHMTELRRMATVPNDRS